MYLARLCFVPFTQKLNCIALHEDFVHTHIQFGHYGFCRFIDAVCREPLLNSNAIHTHIYVFIYNGLELLERARVSNGKSQWVCEKKGHEKHAPQKTVFSVLFALNLLIISNNFKDSITEWKREAFLALSLHFLCTFFHF